MALPTLKDTKDRLTDATLMGEPTEGITLASLGGVPTTRLISTTAPLSGGGDLSADRTLAVAVTPADDGGAVALQGSTPGTVQTGNANLSGTAVAALFSGPVTALKSATTSVDVSAAAAPTVGQGLVATSGTAATWQPLLGTGTVTSIATTAPITGGTITTTGTIGVDTFTSVASGVVPASGGGTTNFMRADGNWTPAGVGAFVSLQGTTPGTPDAGHTNVSGSMIAATAGLGGTNNTALFPLKVGTASSVTAQFASYLNGATGPTIRYEKTRGSETVKTPCVDNDELLMTKLVNLNSLSTPGQDQTPSVIRCDGAPTTLYQPYYAYDSVVGPGFAALHVSRLAAGMYITGGGAYSKPTPSGRLHVAGSVATDTKTKTANYTVTADDYRILCDATSAAFIVTLPSAASIPGRVYEVFKVDSTAHVVQVLGPVSGGSYVALACQDDSISVVSDGTSWWLAADNRSSLIGSIRADSSAIANTASKTAFDTTIAVPAGRILHAGSVFVVKAAGIYSNTGTPTIAFFVSDTGVNHDFAGPVAAFATPSGVTDARWWLEAALTFRTVGVAVAATLLGGYAAVADAAGVVTLNALDNSGGTTSTSIDGVYGIKVTWGAASASNTITMKSFSIVVYGNGSRSS